ncbi:MAG TPA: hypothetical protein VGW33_09590 [Terriglobia bacterium]|nr:hypothetical protein [Terriglobia bacterium]
MESQGAEVVACDVSEEQCWDTSPLALNAQEYEQLIKERKKTIRRLNNSFWLAHRAYSSRARMVYATAYTIPQEIGLVDISTFSSILEHLRDPFLALQNALRLTRETVIITEVVGGTRVRLASAILHLLGKRSPLMLYTQDYREPGPLENWWAFSIDILTNFIGALGFEKYELHRFALRNANNDWGGQAVAIVGHRTQGSPWVDHAANE